MSHRSTLFSQTLSLVPRHVFQKLEGRHKTGRSSRKFGFKEQFTVMAFIQLAARRSMRDGLRALSAAGSRLYQAMWHNRCNSLWIQVPHLAISGSFRSASPLAWRIKCARQV
ncbi:DUF4372 domain-containing protein [Solidesulfovibrio sp.]|uniref:DUF4372 domain-containing protein n=1 Tax=Solidesulfovibrio sp. TaxID=2910990 RepID=UPI0038B4BDE9